MLTWEFTKDIDRTDKLPIFLQIARGISEDIKCGRLKPGAKVPGTRSLARALEVHRNTIFAAYSELIAEGWLVTHPKKGTFVSGEAVPSQSHRLRGTARSAKKGVAPGGVSRQTGFDLRPVVPARRPELFPSTTIHLSCGAPDPRLVPIEELSRAYRRALRISGKQLLGYSDPEGCPKLRAALARLVTETRGLVAGPENVFITKGAQMGLALIARTLVRKDEVVVVESLGYSPAWEAFQLAGAKLMPVPVDECGVCVEAIKELASKLRIRAIYLTPHHQYPTTVTLSRGRRLQLLEFAAANRIAVIEDDYDHDFHYSSRPILPMASEDNAGVVIYLGTLSKVLAPGLRLGYIVAPRPLLDCLAAHRSYLDMHGDQVLETAVSEMIEDGELSRHCNRVRRLYIQRRDALAERLAAELGSVLRFSLPRGGMSIWAEVDRCVNVETWAQQSLSVGANFFTGRRYAFDREPIPYIRLNFAHLTEDELAEGVRRISAALPGAYVTPFRQAKDRMKQ